MNSRTIFLPRHCNDYIKNNTGQMIADKLPDLSCPPVRSPTKPDRSLTVTGQSNEPLQYLFYQKIILSQLKK